MIWLRLHGFFVGVLLLVGLPQDAIGRDLIVRSGVYQKPINVFIEGAAPSPFVPGNGSFSHRILWPVGTIISVIIEYKTQANTPIHRSVGLVDRVHLRLRVVPGSNNIDFIIPRPEVKTWCGLESRQKISQQQSNSASALEVAMIATYLLRLRGEDGCRKYEQEVRTLTKARVRELSDRAPHINTIVF
jgi:hypothetical protein